MKEREDHSNGLDRRGVTVLRYPNDQELMDR